MNDIYTRQGNLNLKTDIKVLVIGTGSIGWNFVKGLVLAGVTNITMFDDDILELHNLNRIDAPASCIGKNKTTLLKSFVDQMRPENNVTAYPFKFNPDVIDGEEYDYLVDCSDVHDVQLNNQEYAHKNHTNYIKLGYDGFNVSINNAVAEWDTGDTPDGYTIVDSYTSSAMIIAGLGVHKILTESTGQVACTVDNMFNN